MYVSFLFIFIINNKWDAASTCDAIENIICLGLGQLKNVLLEFFEKNNDCVWSIDQMLCRLSHF